MRAGSIEAGSCMHGAAAPAPRANTHTAKHDTAVSYDGILASRKAQIPSRALDFVLNFIREIPYIF